MMGAVPKSYCKDKVAEKGNPGAKVIMALENSKLNDGFIPAMTFPLPRVSQTCSQTQHSLLNMANNPPNHLQEWNGQLHYGIFREPNTIRDKQVGTRMWVSLISIWLGKRLVTVESHLTHFTTIEYKGKANYSMS